MPIGTEYQLQFAERTCPKTGKKFLRLTPEGVLSHHAYFYNNIFTPDSRKMLFTSTMTTGRKNFFLLDLDTQKAVQLTDDTVDTVDGFGGALIGADTMIATINNRITKIDLRTLEREVIYTPPEGYITYDTPGISSDGRAIITMDWLEADQETPGLTGWESFLEKSRRGIRSRLVRIDIASRTTRTLLDNADYPVPGVKHLQWLGHPQFCEADPSLVSYCHEGLGGTVDARIWFIQDDGTNIRCPRPHDYPTQIISHEFWFKKSRTMGYVRIDNEEAPTSTIECLDADTQERREIVTLPRSSHFISSHDDRWIIADGDFYEDKLYLYLVDVQAGTYKPLVYHGSISYGRAAEVHAHPLFDNQDRNVVFTSDFEGFSAVYLVPLDD